jgi:two-component system, chemotaxis family, chemotaxis protein CheY
MAEYGQLLSSNKTGLFDTAAPRLLVVEGDTLHRMMICRVAANAGYVPAGAASCDEAIKHLQKTDFDCITLELSLGAHDGNELLMHLSATGRDPNIIIVSGCDEGRRLGSAALGEMLGLRIWESLAKPIDMVALRYWLERLKTEYVPAGAVAA